MVQGVERSRATRVDGLTETQASSPADEGHHREHFQDQHGHEQRHLEPEEARRDVEAGPFLESTEGAHEPRGEPEPRGNAPDVVGDQDAAQSAGIEGAFECAPAEEHRRQTQGQRQRVQRGNYCGDHGEIMNGVSQSMVSRVRDQEERPAGSEGHRACTDLE